MSFFHSYILQLIVWREAANWLPVSGRHHHVNNDCLYQLLYYYSKKIRTVDDARLGGDFGTEEQEAI